MMSLPDTRLAQGEGDPPIGVIGLGLLGGAIARRLRQQGRHVVGFDVSDSARQAWGELGGEVAESARDVVARCGVVVLSLPDSEVVRRVVEEVAGGWRVGAYVIDTTTGDPEPTARLGEQLHSRGVHYLDATLSGSSVQLASGDVVWMVGGREEDFRVCEPLLQSLGRQVFHVGPWGSGATMKLVSNLVLGLNRAVLAEGLALAERCGLDGPTTLEILRAGAGYSRVMDTKGPKMLQRDFTPQAKLSQHLKDVRLILELGSRVAAKLPLSEVHQRLLVEVEQLGYGDADNSAIVQVFL